MFDDATQGAAHGAIAEMVETHDDGVAANGVSGAQPEVVGDVAKRNPVHEGLFDLGAILVVADGAFAGVALDSGLCSAEFEAVASDWEER